MTDREKLAWLYTLIGLLLAIAGCAWEWGAPALGAGGAFMVLIGVLVIDVGGRDRS